MNFLVMPKGIWVEEGSGAGGTCQPQPQWSWCTCMVHMAAWEVDGPSLHPPTQHLQTLLMPPTFQWRWGWLPSRLGGQPSIGPPLPIHFPELQEWRVQVWLLRLLRGGLDTVVVGAWWHLLGGGGVEDIEESDRAPLRSPYKPSASDPATASSIFFSTSTSNCCTSSFNKLVCLSNCSPWKREKGSVTKARLSHKTTKRAVRKAKQYQAKWNTWLNNPCASSSNASTPTSIHEHAQSTSYSTFAAILASSPSDDYLQIRQTQMNKGYLAGRSGKQMSDLMDQLLKKRGTHTAMKLYD